MWLCVTVCDSEEVGLPLCDREVGFATFDMFLIFAKPVVNLPSSTFLQLWLIIFFWALLSI